MTRISLIIFLLIFINKGYTQSVSEKELEVSYKKVKKIKQIPNLGFYIFYEDKLTKGFNADFILEIYNNDLEKIVSTKFNWNTSTILDGGFYNNGKIFFCVRKFSKDQETLKFLFIDTTGKVVSERDFPRKASPIYKMEKYGFLKGHNNELYIIKKPLGSEYSTILDRFDDSFNLVFSKEINFNKAKYDINDIVASEENLFLLLNISDKKGRKAVNNSTNLVCIAGESGKEKFNYNFSNPADTIVYQPMKYLPLKNGDVFITGNYYTKFNKKGSSGLFFQKIDSLGKIKLNKFHNWDQINWDTHFDTTFLSNKYKAELIRDIQIENDSTFKVMAENYYIKSAFGENIALSSLSIATSALAIMSGGIGIPRIAKNVTIIIDDFQTFKYNLASDKLDGISFKKPDHSIFMENPCYIKNIFSASINNEFSYKFSFPITSNLNAYLLRNNHSSDKSYYIVGEDYRFEKIPFNESFSTISGAFQAGQSAIFYEFRDPKKLLITKIPIR